MKLFLDTTVLISAITGRKRSARRVLDGPHELVTNEYAIKEVRRVLSGYFSFPQEKTNLAVDVLRSKVTVLATPPKPEFCKLSLRDKSDAPIVCGALQSNSVLVADDGKTLADSRKYVESMRSDEVP